MRLDQPGHGDSAVFCERLIAGIGEPHFMAELAAGLCTLAGFDLAAIVDHRTEALPVVLFDNFEAVNGREGLANYVQDTHRFNPLIVRAPRNRALCARDFALPAAAMKGRGRGLIVTDPHEELGFRTLGWPCRLEELTLLLPRTRGLLEIGLYRERSAKGVAAPVVAAIEQARSPVAAAFERHVRFASRRGATRGEHRASLSPRENEVCELLLAGYASEAIALRLGIAIHTVKDHRKGIFRKLGVTSLAQLFATLH